MTTDNYSGDITLSGNEDSPVKITSPENVHIKRGAIDGDLEVLNAEYVCTNTPPSGDAAVSEPESVLAGGIEDGYIEPDSVDGDVRIEDASDVFIEHQAVSGELTIAGAEQQFRDESDQSPLQRSAYDETLTGWERSTTVTDPSHGVWITGGKTTTEISTHRDDIELYITGWNNTVEITGQNSTVSVHVVGSHNDIHTGPYVDVSLATDSGPDNAVHSDPVPPTDLIQTSKQEAYSGIFIGQNKVTYQEPAPQQEYCPNCGADSDTVIARKQKNAFFIFGHPVYQFTETGESYECVECSMHGGVDAELTESERKDIFQ
jgi:hypothetical protein